MSARTDTVAISKPALFAGCANTGAAPIVIAIVIAAVNFMCHTKRDYRENETEFQKLRGLVVR